MREISSGKRISQIVGFCFWGAAITAILFYFGHNINEEYAQEWDQVHRMKIPSQMFHVASSTLEYSRGTSGRSEQYLRLDFADAKGKVVTFRGVGTRSDFHVGSVLPGYDLGHGRFLIPYFDKSLPVGIYVLVLSITWGIVGLVCWWNVRRLVLNRG